MAPPSCDRGDVMSALLFSFKCVVYGGESQSLFLLGGRREQITLHGYASLSIAYRRGTGSTNSIYERVLRYVRSLTRTRPWFGYVAFKLESNKFHRVWHTHTHTHTQTYTQTRRNMHTHTNTQTNTHTKLRVRELYENYVACRMACRWHGRVLLGNANYKNARGYSSIEN